jgi:hypothetical protein
MSDTSRDAFLQARQCWPDRGQDELILAPAKEIYEAWQAASPDARRLALDAAVASGLRRLPGMTRSVPNAGTSLCLVPPSRDPYRPYARSQRSKWKRWV